MTHYFNFDYIIRANCASCYSRLNLTHGLKLV